MLPAFIYVISCMYIQPFRTEKRKWYTGQDGYKWLGKDLNILKNVSDHEVRYMLGKEKSLLGTTKK